MKKRNCRLTPEEREQHEQAVRIRKMTDFQIQDHIGKLRAISYDQGIRVGEAKGIEKLLEAVDSNSGVHKKFSKATAEKIRDFAIDEGLILPF